MGEVMSDESVADEQQARTEFERAMRGCRRNVQRRMNQGESGEPAWSDVPDESRSKR